ncbi:MAG: uroporphyrinogen-III synthase [Gammaproteobacteria bacterium]|nr:uroporphyrinogen-III synthase [Gammaproteobacteria bacterium]
MQEPSGPLQGLKVLVTRPAQRASGLCQLIERAGGSAIHFAAIQIDEPDDTRSRDYVRNHLTEFELAIFISPTAVEKTLDYFVALPKNLKLAAIGSKTAHSLASRGLHIDIEPDGHDTEALLKHPLLQAERVSALQIVIFRGEGGRRLLGDTLQHRGANVFYADMYRRLPPADATQLKALLQQSDVITTSSNTGLQNLYDIVEAKHLLTEHTLIVPGQRTFNLARTLGFNDIIIAENATDEACLNALKYAKVKMSD